MQAVAIGRARSFSELREDTGSVPRGTKPSAGKPALLPFPACRALEKDGGRAYLLFFWILNSLVFVGAAATLLRSFSPMAIMKFITMVATGIMVSAQSSIIITYIRMKLAMRDYMENNNKFEGSLRLQEMRVKELQKLADTFEQLDQQFGGSVEELGREIERLQAISESSMRSNVKTLLRLYCDANRDRMIEFGDEVQNTVGILEGVFNIVCPDIGPRFKAMIRGLRTAFKAPANGVPLMNFLDAVDLALAEDPEKIEQEVMRAMVKVDTE